MNPPSPPPDPPPSQAGKTRTWWHPLLANLLRWQLGDHYHLQEEVPVGVKPLQIDLMLLRKEQGELPPSARQILAGLVEYLGELTLIEFKSPSDTLRAGDFHTFLAYSLLYRAQHDPMLHPRKLHLLVIAPSLTKPYREEMQTLGVTEEVEEPGIWRLRGGILVHPTWALETEKLAGLEHPLLTLISPHFLKERLATYDMLNKGGYTNLAAYLAQQVQQFHLLGKEFAMQHLGAEDQMQQVLLDFLASLPIDERLAGLSEKDILAHIPIEKRLAGLSEKDILEHIPIDQRLAGLSEKDILAHIPIDQRLAGLAPEEQLRALTPEALERLRQIIAPTGEGT